ncbi:sialate O-acetylesterase [Coraliomargarita algicola]|uniref:Sialate O-acetylesterase n=1 Tax=Coraliomargarita algicola TaxID=3092156 RepID=A0ABZ0RL11_9BACT|nr:sialate O-acetylesterase [Coraliomargarita sp. J2-16]WPJ95617.1 sialate O-acetylesterase [Coraliomargarita sp. J2-16]
MCLNWNTLIATAAMCLTTLNLASAAIEPMGLITDGAILQRQQPIPVWGWADPGEAITVTLNGHSVKAVSDSTGKWTLQLPAMEAAMDLTMEISGEGATESITVKNVAIGEVWLASGQSNMEWLLKWVDMSDVADAPANPMIREARVSGIGSFREPNEKSRGSWKMDTPDHRPNFSAVGYRFASKLQHELGVPVGIIKAAVGGTAVEPWTPREVVDAIRPIWSREYWAAYDAYPAQKKQYLAAVDAWLLENQRVDTREQSEPKGSLKPADDLAWTTVLTSQALPESLYSGYGVIWLRKTIEVPAGRFDDKATYFRTYTKDSYSDLYVNGQLIYDTTFESYPGQGTWVTARINPGVLQAGSNEIALRVYSPFVPFQMDRAYSIDDVKMDASWEAQVEVDYGAPSEAALASMPQMPKSQVGYGRLPAVHFNRFIAPIAGYAMRGVIWYQGETNAQQHEEAEYAQVFPAMIQSWRTLWGQPDMPFYYCQLAAYGSKSPDPAAVGWAPFRRAQEAALELPNTGQAVLIDVGESDIHPYDKLSVGDRLARLAFANDYNLDVVDSGPVMESVTLDEQGGVTVSFRSLAGGLVAQALPERYAVSHKKAQYRPFVRYAPDSELEGFALQDAAGKWHWAEASIHGDTVKVHSASAPQPVAIRYNWQSYPNGNLANSEGLPATPFESVLSH